MADINRVEVTGNLTRDAELRMTKGGKQVVSFGLAVGDGFGENARTFFFDCIRWCGSERQAEFFSQLAKGQKVAIAGKLSYSTWTKEGQKRSKVEIVIQELVMFGAPLKDPRDYAPGQQMPLAAATPQAPPMELYDEEIPFS